MKIRVAMLADLPEPGEVIDGGVQAVTAGLTRAMADCSRVELHVVRLRLGVERAKTLETGTHVLHVLPMSRLGTLTGFARDQKTLDRCLHSIGPDLVHCQGTGHYGILAHRTEYPSVTTVHGILSEEVRFERGFRNRIRAALQAQMSDRMCIRRARHTILISQYVSNYYGEKLAGARYLVPNPVDEQFFEVVRREIDGKILFAGRLTERKGVKDLLRAVAALGDASGARVVLAGSLADESYVEELRLLSGRLDIMDRVEFAGSLSMSELTRELAESSCLVLPSYQETAPMVIQEAMAAGVPVVATDICGVPFQIDHGNTGFIYPPHDVAKLTKHLGQLMASRETRERIGARAKTEAREKYRAAAVAARTIEVYESVLASKA